MIRELGILAVVALHLLVSTTADPITPTETDELTPVIYHKQLWDLFWHVDQPEKIHRELYDRGIEWDFEVNISLYKDPSVVQEFLYLWKYTKFQRGQLFSLSNEYHKTIVAAFTKILIAAKDAKTFISSAAWGRVHFNEYGFVTALYTAILRRPDTRNFVLPSHIDVEPYNYFSSEVMQQIYDLKASFDPQNATSEPFIVYANYSNYYNWNIREPESELAFFREDPSLNAFLFAVKQEFPTFLSSAEYNMNSVLRGERYYSIYKTLRGLYYLQGLSHGVHELQSGDWSRPILPGFKPIISHRNGQQYPSREPQSDFPPHLYDIIGRARAYAGRILETVDRGSFVFPYGTSTEKQESIYTREGFSQLANIIEGNADSVNLKYYGTFEEYLRQLFGFSTESTSPYKASPSVLENPATSIWDPAAFRLIDIILEFFEEFTEHLPAYTHEDLFFPGVEITSVAVDKLETYFKEVDFSTSGGFQAYSDEDANRMKVNVRQPRLGYHPFSLHLSVNSDGEKPAYIYIFIGPKYNSHGEELLFSEIYDYFYKIDTFKVDLKAGLNKIERKSINFTYFNSEYEGGDVFYSKLRESIETHGDLPPHKRGVGFPRHVLLPRGKPEGFPIQFYVFVDKYDEKPGAVPHSHVLGDALHNNKPNDYPLNRQLFAHNITVQNSYLKTTYVYHKGKLTPSWTV